MNVPPNDSVAWIYIRMIVMSGILFAFCEFAYKNHLSSTDIQMIVTVVSVVLGVDLTKRFAAPSSHSSSTPKE